MCEGEEWKFVGGVAVWQRTDSPATPLPKAITALNHSAITPQPPAEALKRLTRLDETRKGGNKTKVENMGFSPID